ncbi:MAG: VCBS repeat-containing protein, partial [Spirochaetales bacterium]|nr:VCBS repeat-containing protein [Spirochaetales bacterium]
MGTQDRDKVNIDSKPDSIIHRGFDDFSRGRFDNGGDNLYVNASGKIGMIHSTDVNDDGYVDIVLPNSHADSERGPTRVYSQSADGEWSMAELPNDSGWISLVTDVDGDGYPDLVVSNAENGVTSELNSYIYWGGPDGLTEERTELATSGAYQVAAVDLAGNGLPHLIFTSAWVDHHNPGQPRPLHVFEQVSPRSFVDRAEEFGIMGTAARSLVAADLNQNGHMDLVVANYRREFEYDIESYIYRGTDSGFDRTPVRLPSHFALQAAVGDLNGDGFSEVVFAGGNQLWIYWNRNGQFNPDDRTILDFTGGLTEMEFRIGAIFAHIADIDGDGKNELIVAAAQGIEIRRQDDLTVTASEIPLASCTWLHTADLTGDGSLDMIASRYQDGESFNCESAVFWNGSGGYSLERATWLATSGAMGCTAGDLNGDGKPEIIFNSTHTGWSRWDPKFPLYVYLGNEHNEYSTDRRLALPTGHSNTYLVADLNQDGYADLACTSRLGLRIFYGGPEGLNPERYVDLPHKGHGFHYILAADLNKDGWLDLVGIAMTHDSSAESLATSSVIFYGSPDGFSLDSAQPLPTSARGNAMLADVNRDGW